MVYPCISRVFRGPAARLSEDYRILLSIIVTCKCVNQRIKFAAQRRSADKVIGQVMILGVVPLHRRLLVTIDNNPS